eukprot:m.115836 g.115836  ORF g.115836 m.115836 type:complete len:150 (+) comp19411_c0_seq4:75-524(+)
MRQEYTVANVNVNYTYHVAIQGIGNSESYSLTAQLTPRPYIPPTLLEVDDMPTSAEVSQYQYADFIVHAARNGNYTVGIYLQDPFDWAYVYVKSLPVLPTAGNYLYRLDVEHHGVWCTVSCPYVRNGTDLGIAVHASNHQAFFIRVQVA